MERTEQTKRTSWAGSSASGMTARSALEMPPVLRRAAPVQPAPVATARDGAAQQEPARAMQGMQAELEALRARLADAAPRRAVVEMDRAISVLHRQVADLSGVQDAAGRAEAGLLTRELSELRAALDDLRSPQRFQALAAGLDVLSRKIELMDAKAVSPVEVARLQAQSDQLADLVRRSLSGVGVQALVERLDACSAQVSRAGEAAACKVEAATVVFESKARELLSRMDRMKPGADMAEGVALIHQRLDRFGAQLDDLSPADGRLDDRLAHLSAQLEALATKENAAVEPAAAPLVAAVEQHLLALHDRFDDTSGHLGRLDAIEAGLQDILSELHHVRLSSAEATAEAVQAVALKVSDAADGPAVVGLKRGLAALEARQNEVERRASEWLGEPFHDAALVLGRTDDGVWAPHAADVKPEAAPVPEPVVPDEDITAEPVMDEPQTGWKASPRMEPRWTPRQETPAAPKADAASGDAEFDTAFAEALNAGRPEPAPEATATSRRAGRVTEPATGTAKAGPSRPRVMRGNRVRPSRPQTNNVSWKGVAVSVLAVALVSSAGLVWMKRDALQGQASALVASMRAAAPVSVADLPEPVGPAALQTAARTGDRAAAHQVGLRYAEGMGVPTNLDAAVKWLGYAVSQGSPQAAFSLASLYESGVPNPAEAVRFYKWAAEQGHVQAMHNLAALYAKGVDGKTADWAQAIHWFHAAAGYGKRDAQHNLGVIYARGFAGQTDMKEALTWFSIAANQGDADSAQKRDELVAKMDAPEVDEVRRHAAAFRAHPVNDAVNMLASRPEWTDPDDKGKMADTSRPYPSEQNAALAPHTISSQMFSSQAMNAMSGQMVASNR